ncbi:MAG: hypothetical protein RBR67_17775, partial [Desulfobacterium sp.]|nr:hypothetical protein [Desulfobacterium sp.]
HAKEAEEKAEKERLAKEAEEKAEKERLAKEAEEKAEKERLAKEAEEKAEKERLAKEAEEKAEKERLAKEAEEKAEKERLAKEAEEKAEKERLAKEAEEKAEKERLAKEAEEKAAQRAIEIKRVIREIAEKEAKEAEANESHIQGADNTSAARTKYIPAILAGICFVLLLLMVVGTSISNSKKFYIKHTNAGVEIWKGQFAPISTQKIVFLKNIKLPKMTQKVYSKQDIFPIPFNYYLGMADNLIKEQGLPDFQPLIDLVGKASDFATTTEEKETIARYKSTIHDALMNIKSTEIVLPIQAAEQESAPAAAEPNREGENALPALETQE